MRSEVPGIHTSEFGVAQTMQLFSRFEGNPILEPPTWPYPVNSVINPGATILPNGETLLLVRVEDRSGLSHLTVARSADGLTDWSVGPTASLMCDLSSAEERWGIEDPRITQIGDDYLIAYKGLSRHGPLVRLARTRDFAAFESLGTISHPEDKDAALFSATFAGRYAMLHRPVSAWAGGEAHIWISFSPDLVHWGEPRALIETRRGGYWDQVKVGTGPPPLPTTEGWLVMFHGAKSTASGLLYRAGLALLDLDDPTRVLARADEWVFGPETPYELSGDVAGVVFPTGWVLLDDGTLQIYYGAADTSVGVARADLAEVLDFTLQNSI